MGPEHAHGPVAAAGSVAACLKQRKPAVRRVVWHRPLLPPERVNFLSLPESRLAVNDPPPAERSPQQLAARREAHSGLNWTRRDKIPNMRDADQLVSARTDKWRTESAIHTAVIAGATGQRPFRWGGMSGL